MYIMSLVGTRCSQDWLENFHVSKETFTYICDKWLVDSGASSHMTSNKKILTNFCEFKKPEKVDLGEPQLFLL